MKSLNFTLQAMRVSHSEGCVLLRDSTHDNVDDRRKKLKIVGLSIMQVRNDKDFD